MPYIELHSHSCFSLLDGASFPEALITHAAALEMPALALTDHDAVYAAPQFVRAAKAAGIKSILGAELTLVGGQHLTLLVENAVGWQNLCTLISLGRGNAQKGEAALPPGLLAEHTEGLVALSGCRQGEIAAALLRGDQTSALNAARRYRDWFGHGRFWIELQRHLLPDDEGLTKSLVDLAGAVGAGIVATNNVHYAERSGYRLQDVLVCIRHNATLEASANLRRPNSEFYLKGHTQLAPLFHKWPKALTNTLRIAEQLDFDLQYGLQDLPQFPTPNDIPAADYLRQLCIDALPMRYPGASSDVIVRLDHELGIIERGHLSNYFLIVHDIVRFARSRGIRCQGRGSAANSLVAYLLGISPIDPLAHDLVFERFLSDERNLPPDIDLDFATPEPRESVIQYIYERYGHEHAAMACTFITFRARSALRDVGKALGLPLDLIDRAAKSLETWDAGKIGEQVPGESAPWQQLLELCRQIDRFPRHLGIHNGGMVITGVPLAQRLPTEPATMEARLVCQWDKGGLEEAGLVKIDLLGLRMLSVLSDACDLVETATGQRPDLDVLTFSDNAIFDLIAHADTIGVFQVESRAQAQMLPRFRPRCLGDLIIAISLIRPGPIQGGAVHPYLRRRLGEEPVTYPHPSLIPALAETLGVLLFQEQCVKLGRDVAGFTPGQAELMRRALGSKNALALIDGLRSTFVDGAVSKEIPQAVAEEVFEKLRAFGSYSFPKSHAAAFAVIVYQSAWLKVYHPLAFYCALLNNQPMGFWPPSIIVNDAKHHNIRVLPVDVHRSDGPCTLEGDALRLGLKYVKGMGEASAERIVEMRGQRPFKDLPDFCRRTCLPKRLVENLILAEAMNAFGSHQRKLLWDLGRLVYHEEMLELVTNSEDVPLEPMTELEAFGYSYSVLGLSVDEHPINFVRHLLDAQGVITGAALRNCEPGQIVRVGGLNVMHQAPPTAKGVHFVSLDDASETNFVNVIFHKEIYDRHRAIVRSSRILIVEGQVQRNGEVINVIASRAYSLQVA